MSYIKQPKELDVIQQGGEILGKILEHILDAAESGVNMAHLDQMAEEKILEAGGRPTFKGYQPSAKKDPFPSTICASINEEVVHGIAEEGKILQEGDLLSIDIGMEWPVEKSKQNISNSDSEFGGYITDTAATKIIGEANKENRKLKTTTRKALYAGIEQAKPGNTVADIGRAVEDFVEPFGYGIVRDLCGHGVGHGIHEEPNVFNFYKEEMEEYKLEEGVVIAIEPMLIISGNPNVKTAEDGWSIVSKDESMTAHFEHTVIIREDGPEIATKRPNEAI